MTKIRQVVALVFLVFLGTALYLSFSFPKQAKVLPLLVLVPVVLTALWNFIAELKSKPVVKDEEAAEGGQVKSFYTIFLAALSLPLLSWLAGITIGLPLFMFIYLRWVSKEGWGTVIFSVILSWVILYLGFEVLMQSDFDQGVIFKLMGIGE